MTRALVVAALLFTAAACKPKIGDSCNSSIDCSANGGRVCDTASPGGYCTIRGCDPNGCPDNAVCVEWRYAQDRTSATWCMQSCSSSGDCDRSGYRCLHEDAPELVVDAGVADGGPDAGPVQLVEPLARVTDFDDRADNGFCVYVGN